MSAFVTMAERKEQRLQQLFSECQQQVISQIIGPFGLSKAMFEDRNGGNVTTVRNFSRTDDDYVATADDRVLHQHAHTEYSPEVRADYEIKTQQKAGGKGSKTWDDKRDAKIEQGKDEYTGAAVTREGTTYVRDAATGNTVEVRVELDHITSIGETHANKKVQLGMGVVKDGEADVSRIRNMVNHDDNLALTNQPANGSKSQNDLKTWSEAERTDGTTNADHFDLKPELVDPLYERSKEHIEKQARNALFKKQGTELLKTGASQAARMGLKQAIGVLLTELINGIFNEVKTLLQSGVELGKTLFEEITERLAKIGISVAKKLPDAFAQGLQGGVSGFMSNLTTFLINNFVSTAKRFVTIIRDQFLSLYKALKIMIFPPEHLTRQQAIQEGIKALTTVLVISLGFLLEESVSAFMATVPFLKPVADMVTPVLVGIMTGLLSAFLAYQIDNLFERLFDDRSERQIDQQLANVQVQQTLADELARSASLALDNVSRYAESIALYQAVGEHFGVAGRAANATQVSLRATLAETGKELSLTQSTVADIKASQLQIDAFLKTF